MLQDDRALTHLDDDDECPGNGKEKKGESPLVARLLKARTILIAKPVDKDLMREVSAQLLVLSDEDSSKPITVYVNSPGGDADSGFAIYDMMRFVKAPVRTVCAGLAASAAVIIYLGGEKGQRFCLPNSRFLIHQPSTYTQGQASDIEITANEIVKIRRKYNEIVSQETGTPVDKIEQDANRDFWLSAEESKAYGLVDAIVAAQGEMG
ncbi:MAG: ClpP family protease [Planctomycetota bacterium JB042]